MQLFVGIFSLIFSFYLCFLPVYALFFDSAEDAVESISIEESFNNYINKLKDITDGDLLDDYSERLEQFEKRTDLDLQKPISDVLKEHKISFAIRKLAHIDDARKIGDTSGGDVSLYAYEFYYNNLNLTIHVTVENPSYFKVKRANVIYTGENYQHLLMLYGASQEQIDVFRRMFSLIL